MNGLTKRILVAGFGILCISLLAWAFQEGRERSTQKAGAVRRADSVSQISTQDGQIIIRLDSSAEARMGLKVASLQAATHRQELRGNAVVLSAQELTDLRKNYLNSSTELEKANAALNASKQEYDRLDTLHQQDQSASTKALQAAEATWRTDQATVKAAESALHLNEVTVRQNWGDVITRWLIDASPELNRVLELKDVLLQVSPRQELGASLSGSALIQTSDGKNHTASFLSALPKIDPRLQTPSFLYIVTSRPNVVPGMTLSVLLTSGPLVKGISVPRGAIVWSQGKAWAYVQSAPDTFLRREVPTQVPLDGGWFVTEGFSPGDKVVITGAQQLLSEEFRSQTHVVGEEDEN